MSFIFLGHVLWSFFKRKNPQQQETGKTRVHWDEYVWIIPHTYLPQSHSKQFMTQKTCDLNTLSALKIQFIWLLCNAHEQYNTYSGHICITSIQSINCQAPLANSLVLLISPSSQLKISGAKDIHSAMNARSSLSTLQNFSVKKLFNA